jgi:Lrp/AsnC family transcriptional regulator for asnA, asnC and gidA
MNKLDEIDIKILNELVNDAGQSVPKLSKKIQVNASVTYSRIKRLLKRGTIKKFTIEVNEEQLGWKVTAYIGLDTDAKKRDKVYEELLKLDEIRDVCEVTGRFDLIAKVKAKSLEELHDVVSNKIGHIDGVDHTETFIAMKSSSKVPNYTLPTQ